MTFPSSDRDLEQLSAYLDHALSPSERSTLEARLAADARLRKTLDELRAVKMNLRELPPVKPPRSFTLTPKMAGTPLRGVPSFVPALNWATAIAALLFAVLLTADLSGGFSARELAAPAPEAAMLAQTPAEVNSGAVAVSPTALAPAAGVPAPTVGEGFADLAPAPLTEKVLTESASAADQAASVTATPIRTEEQTQATVTPTIDSSLRAAVTPAPTLTPPAPGAAPPAPAAARPAPSPLRAAELALGLILIGLIAVTLLARRR